MEGRRSARWFSDQWVFSEDLLFGELAASYGTKGLARAVVSQWGVAIYDLTEAGLQVTAATNTFSVAPGRCVDINGNVIYVPGQYYDAGGNAQIGNPGDEGYVPAGVYPQNQNLNALGAWNGAHYVTIAYALASGSLQVDDDGVAYPTRAYDTYVIVDLQTPGTTGVQIPLATITTQSGSVVAIQDTRPILSTYSQANVSALESHQRYLHACGLVSPDGTVPYASASGSLGAMYYPTAGKDYLAFQQLSVPGGGTVADMVYINGKQIVSLQGALTFNYDGLATSGSYAFYVQDNGTIGYDYTYAGYYIPPTEDALQSSRTKYYFAGGHYNPNASSGAMWTQVASAVGLQDLRRYYALRADQIRNVPSGSLTATNVQDALYQTFADPGTYVKRVGDIMTGATKGLEFGNIAVPFPAGKSPIRIIPAADVGYPALVLRDETDGMNHFVIGRDGSLFVYDQPGSGIAVVGIGYSDPATGKQGAVLVYDADNPAGTETALRPSTVVDGIGVRTKGKIATAVGIQGPEGLVVNPSRQVAAHTEGIGSRAVKLFTQSTGGTWHNLSNWTIVFLINLTGVCTQALHVFLTPRWTSTPSGAVSIEFLTFFSSATYIEVYARTTGEWTGVVDVLVIGV